MYGARPDTGPFASMLSAIGAAVAGQDVNVAAAAGGNAAANNFLNHTQAALMQQELDACRTKASGCTDDQVVAIFGKFRDASNQNIEAVQACIKAGNVACVQSLEAQAASASEVSDALPLGYGKLESELVARQDNVNNHGSFNPYSVFGTDAQQAQEVAIFRSDNCANLSAAACDSLVQQALDDRMERFAVLTAVGAIVPGAGMGLRRLTLPKSPGGNYAASPRQSQGQFNDSLPIQRIVYNGVELEPSLPPPAAGYGYAPSSLKGATTSNLANSHVSGFLAEIRLANEIAAQGQVVVKWGGAIGTRGNDLISINPATGEVALWDSKYRSATTSIQQSPTFANSRTRDGAIEEALDAVNEAQLPADIRATAIKNLTDGTFTTNTAGAGGVKNSVQVRYCGHKPC